MTAEFGIYTREEMSALCRLEDAVRKARDMDILENGHLSHVSKVGGFEHYWEARKMGIQMEANEILLSEGIPQVITKQQKNQLKNIDKMYKI